MRRVIIIAGFVTATLLMSFLLPPLPFQDDESNMHLHRALLIGCDEYYETYYTGYRAAAAWRI